MSEENKILTRRLVEELFGQGNLAIVDEIVDANYVGHDPDNPQEMHGPEDVKQFASMYLNAFSDIQISVEDQIAEGDNVVTRWRGTGTHQGELMGIRPTGNRAELIGITISSIANGKIVEEWTTSGTLSMMQQLGVVSPPGQGAGVESG